MGVLDEVTSGLPEESTSRFLRGADFDGDGQILTVVGVEKFKPENPKYGVKNTYGAGGVLEKKHWFIDKGLLEEGESFKYRFTQNDLPKEFDNSSLSFFFAFKDANPEQGQIVTIKRNKKSDQDIEWTITQ